MEIKLAKANAQRKQVRKISFSPNDEEGCSNSQKVLFPICGYSLHRWSKLASETQLVAGDATSPSLVSSYLPFFLTALSPLHDSDA